MGKSYKNPDTLHELYHDRNLTLSEVADELNTSQSTIHRWMDKLGIDKNSPGGDVADERLNDPDWLEREYSVKQRSVADIAEETGSSNRTILKRLKEYNIGTRPAQRLPGSPKVYDCDFLHTEYVENKKHAKEIADEIGVGKTTVLRQMENCGIERRSKSVASEMASDRVNWAAFYTSKNGYENHVCKVGNGSVSVGLHRLVAIANGADPHTVFDGDHHVHHKNGIPWDNRPDNLEVMTASEHSKEHHGRTN